MMKRFLAFLIAFATFGAFAQTGPVFNSPPRFNAAGVVITGGTLDGLTRVRIGTSSILISGTEVLTATAAGTAATFRTTGAATTTAGVFWNSATSNDNRFLQFYSDGGSGTFRGDIRFLRANTGMMFSGESRVDLGIAGTSVINVTSTGMAAASATVARTTAANFTVPYVLCQSAVAVNAGAVTTEETLYTCTVPAGAMGANGSLRIAVVWSYTNGADDKILRIRYSGASGTQYLTLTATTTASFHYQTTITNRNATNSQVGNTQLAAVHGVSTSTPVTSAVDTTAQTTVVVTCQKETSGDTCTMERIIVELLYGASASLDRFVPDSLRNAIAANQDLYKAAA